MELWNDFEGKVVDDRFRLGRLLAPKGRSAFFTATTLSGEPITMRLIESLNDEDEILARWQLVEGIREEHLQRLAASGKTVLDGTHLVYAVLEPTDMSLDEVLRDRTLTGEETRQMAGAVVAGLEALHRAGLVHEHVDAQSVLARGETVKLRSDCVREMPEGAEGEALRRGDARDLALLVGYALTRRKDATQGGALPRQFEDLVRNGMSGTWGMKEMSALLRPAAATAAAASGTAAPVARGPVPNGPALVGAKPAGPTTPAAAAGGKGEGTGAAGAKGRPSTRVPAGDVPGAAAGGRQKDAGAATGVAAAGAARQSTAPTAVASALLEEDADNAAGARSVEGRRAVEESEEPRHRFSAGPWIAAGVVALVLILLIVHFARGGSGAKAVAPTTVGTPATAPAAAVPAVTTPAPPAAAMTATTGSGSWRVIAFTYMHRDQAQHKAEQIAAKHGELQPEVFSPHGGAPFLVAVGGWMTEREAITLRARVRREGLPRDTYARNYHRP